MSSKKEILREYFDISIKADVLLDKLEKEEPYMCSLDVSCTEQRLNKFNATLAEMEDANPWIANVLVAMEGA